MLEYTRNRCKEIRNQFYPLEEWPGIIYRNRLLQSSSRGRVLLDIGCGRDARLLKSISNNYGKCIGIDIDIPKHGIHSADYNFLCADAHHIPLHSSTVDIIAMNDVVEHLADPRAVFQECARVLRPGGKLIILTVNKRYFPIALGRFLPHRFCQVLNHMITGTSEEDTFYTYYRANTPQSLKALIKNTGLCPLKIKYLGHHPHYLMFSVSIYRLGIIIEKIIRRYEFLAPLRHLIYGEFVRIDGDTLHSSSSRN